MLRSFVFRGSLDLRCGRAQVQQREASRGQTLAVFRRRHFHAFCLAGIFDQRMLGGQAFLRLEKFRGLLFGVPEASRAVIISFLSVSAAGSRKASIQ